MCVMTAIDSLSMDNLGTICSLFLYYHQNRFKQESWLHIVITCAEFNTRES